MTAHSSRPVTFTGAAGNTLVGEVTGEDGPPVLLLHGGGQTRHAWRKTNEVIARLGRVAYAVDQRGHGDSEWVADGAYTFPDFAADAKVLSDTLTKQTGKRPVAVGASLGGIASMLASRHLWRRCSRRWCWSTSRRGSISTASPRCRASCARMPAKASRRSRRPPKRSPPICRTGRGRAPTKG